MAPRRLALGIAATVLLIAGTYAGARHASTTPPAAPAPVATSAGPPVGMKTTDELIAFWRGRVERNPRDFISFAYLGEAFIRKARETGDLGDYARAEIALRRAQDLDAKYEPTLAFLSTVRYMQHDFAGALALATRVSQTDPQAAQALATVGDAHLELGHYREAEAAYQELAQRAPGPASASRQGRLAWLQGHPAVALAKLQGAARAAAEQGLTGESAAWYQLQVGELAFQTGDISAAAQAYRAALATFPTYYLALAALGKARAAEGRSAEAIDLYTRAIAVVPQPEFLAALGDLYALIGHPEEADRQYATVEVIGHLAAINNVIYNRQLALFYADHDRKLDEALALAHGELTMRPDIYGYDALAWALYKNGRYQEAAEASEQARALGTQDALLFYHAGMIAHGLGHDDQARAYLAHALALNPHFSLLQVPTARATLRALGG
jgi:tetratricopeptide (TPR) repeat protein